MSTRKPLPECRECGWQAGHAIHCVSRGKLKPPEFRACPCGISYLECEYHWDYPTEDTQRMGIT